MWKGLHVLLILLYNLWGIPISDDKTIERPRWVCGSETHLSCSIILPLDGVCQDWVTTGRWSQDISLPPHLTPPCRGVQLVFAGEKSGGREVVIERESRGRELSAIVQQWQVYTINVTLHKYKLEWNKKTKCSTVQCSSVQCSTMQCSAVQWTAVQCSAPLAGQNICTQLRVGMTSG